MKNINTENKHIFILGAGPLQIPAIKAAKKRGWYVTVADGNPKASGVCFADEFVPIDLKDTDSLVNYAQNLCKTKFDGVFTAGTDFSVAVSSIAEKLNLPGHSLQAAKNASDKFLMRSCFKNADVPSPDFILVDSKNYSETQNGDNSILTKINNCLGFPLVVKPVDNMGARGCQLVSAFEELPLAIKKAQNNSRSNRAIAENFMDGPEFSVDALVFDGEVHITGFAMRHIFYPPYFIEMGHTMPADFPQDKIEELISVFKKGVFALGLSWGAAKGDIKYTSKGAMIGEIAGRLSGGYMSGWTYPYSSGVNLTEQALLLAVGERPNALQPLYEKISAERAWISIPGVIAKTPTSEELAKLKENSCVKILMPRYKVGDKVVFPTNNVEKCGNVITVCEDRKKAISVANDICSKIVIQLEKNNEQTDDFLCKPLGGEGFPPDAFCLPDELSSIINNLPDTYLNDLPDAHLENILQDVEKTSEKLQIKKLLKIDVSKYIKNHKTTGNKINLFYEPLPQDVEFYLQKNILYDWNHRSFSDTIKYLEHNGYIKKSNKKINDSDSVILNGIFWRSVFRGGLQGALYVASKFVL